MLPNGFEEKMQALLGPEYEAFLQALDGPRHVGLRRNPRKPLEPQDLDFGLSPVPWEPLGHTYDPSCRPGLDPRHEAGGFYLQEPSAMAPVALLDPQPGERILDLCAAPGGKSTQIAGRLMGSGLLVCNEIHPKRAKILSSNLERLGIENALVLNEHPQSLAARFAGFFDRVLVDAPCSGEGLFRKHDEAVTDWSAETVAMCARRQQEILQSAACMLRPGGRLVYSTCTFSPEEDEGTVALFLERHPDFFVEPQDTPWFAPGRPEWVPGGRAELAGTVRLWPHKLAGEGHFAAVLRKEGKPRTEAMPVAAAPAGGIIADSGRVKPGKNGLEHRGKNGKDQRGKRGKAAGKGKRRDPREADLLRLWQEFAEDTLRPAGSDFDILDVGFERLMIRAPTLGM